MIKWGGKNRKKGKEKLIPIFRSCEFGMSFKGFNVNLIPHRQQRYDDYGHDAGYGDGEAAHGAGHIAFGDDSGGAYCVAGGSGCQTPGNVGFNPQQLAQCGGDDGAKDAGTDDCDNSAAYDAAHFPGNTGGNRSSNGFRGQAGVDFQRQMEGF